MGTQARLSTGETGPLASVIIINWNGRPYLERTLQALADQTFRDFETILIDNGSTDGSVDGLESRWPEIRVRRLPQNLGFAAANNLGVALSRGTWIALLNNDAFPRTDWLEVLLAAAAENPEYSFFASCLLWAGRADCLDGLGDLYHFSGYARRHGHGRPLTGTLLARTEVFGPCAAAALYRREDMLSAGGFDEHYFCYHEDVDLAFRLRLLGHRCLLIPEAIVEHLGSGSQGSASDFTRYYNHRNLVWTFVKNMPGVLFYLFLPAHLLLNLGTLGYFTLAGQGAVIRRAKKDALRALGRVWHQRRTIQKNRRLPVWRLLKNLDLGFLPHIGPPR
ncbi:MAG: glycosyltransferase family 2 protein [Deltaproteobacteria bacterium]|nr:glycosyltransferase family 2 protein [Deltaproteobacteria bacterium]